MYAYRWIWDIRVVFFFTGNVSIGISSNGKLISTG